MIDLRTGLHEASPIDGIVGPDVADLRRLAVRGRFRRRVLTATTAIAVLAVVGTAVWSFVTEQPGGITVDIAATPAETAQSSVEPTTTTAAPTPVDPDGYAEWRAYWQDQLEAALAAATPAQQPALADDVITEQEWLSSAADWEACVQEAGYDFQLLREEPGPPGSPPGWVYDNPAIPAEDLQDFNDAVADCAREHVVAIQALWREQQADHVTWWNTLQDPDWADGNPNPTSDRRTS